MATPVLIRMLRDYLALSFVLGLIGLASAYPDIPTTPLAWIALFAFAVPVWLAAEFCGHLLWKNRLARFVDDATQTQSFSLARIAYGVLTILLVIGLVAGAIHGWDMLRPLLGA
jgi:hypothetical protein